LPVAATARKPMRMFARSAVTTAAAVLALLVMLAPASALDRNTVEIA